MALTLVSTVQVPSGGAASIEFTNIPQTGKDLLILASLRNADSNITAYVRLNGDTGSNYDYRDLQGNGASVSSNNYSDGDRVDFGGGVVPTAATASTFSNIQIYVSNYTSSTGKSLSYDGVTENNATTAYQTITAGYWGGTAAVTSFALLGLGRNYNQYSSASLYIVS